MKILKNSEVIALGAEARATYDAEFAKLVELYRKTKSADLVIEVPVKSFNVGYEGKDGKQYVAFNLHADEAIYADSVKQIVEGNVPNTLQIREGMGDNIAKSLSLDSFEELSMIANSFTDKGSVKFALKLCIEGEAWGDEADQKYLKTHIRTENIEYVASEYFSEMFADAIQHGLRTKMAAKFTGRSKAKIGSKPANDPLDMDNVPF